MAEDIIRIPTVKGEVVIQWIDGQWRTATPEPPTITEEEWRDLRLSCARMATAYDPQESSVYFIGAEGGPIKIGYAKDVRGRLREMQTGNAAELTLLATVSGGRSVETFYHIKFEQHRLRGEWFERHPDILAEIKRLSEGSASLNPLLSGDSPNG